MGDESQFTVRDRRRTREDVAPSTRTSPDALAVPLTAQLSDASNTEPPSSRGPRPPVSVAELLIGLATSAFVALGLQPADAGGLVDPSGQAAGGPPVDLEQARHLIDMLAMLEQKTAGNLTPEETALLQQLLYSLRLAFVDKSRAAWRAPSGGAPGTAT